MAFVRKEDLQHIPPDGVSLLTSTCDTTAFSVDSSEVCLTTCGDCNQDGAGPDILDSLKAAQLAAGIGTPMGAEIGCCDTDGDGDIDVLDALAIAQLAVGLPVMLMCP